MNRLKYGGLIEYRLNGQFEYKRECDMKLNESNMWNIHMKLEFTLNNNKSKKKLYDLLLYQKRG